MIVHIFRINNRMLKPHNINTRIRRQLIWEICAGIYPVFRKKATASFFIMLRISQLFITVWPAIYYGLASYLLRFGQLFITVWPAIY